MFAITGRRFPQWAAAGDSLPVGDILEEMMWIQEVYSSSNACFGERVY